MKKILVVLLVLGAAASAFAQENIFASWNTPKHLNADVGVGLYYYEIGVTGGIEYVAGEFNLGPVPMDWGLMARGGVGFPGLGFGVGGLGTLHFGLKWNLDFCIGLGVAFHSPSAFPIGLAEYSSVTYLFSKSVGVSLEYSYLGNSIAGVGLQFKL